MAHKIFTKTTSGWKEVKKPQVKESDGWKRIKKGWVKINDTDWKLFFAKGIPKGAIVPYFGIGPITTAGWIEYTPADERLIIGADDARPPKTSGGANSIKQTGYMAAAGAHGSGIALGTYTVALSGDSDFSPIVQRDSDGVTGYDRGGHSHNARTAWLNVEPKNTHVRLIKSTGEGESLPAEAGIFSVADMSGFGFDRVNDYNGTLFSSGSNPGSVTGVEQDVSGWTTETRGAHQHAVVNYSLNYNCSGTQYYTGTEGGHTHYGKFTAYMVRYNNDGTYRDEAYLNTAMALWKPAGYAYENAPGIIIMWEGASAPEGWAICNGQNGTPDLRNRFIKYAVPGTEGRRYGIGKLPIAVPTSTNGLHGHNNTTCRGAAYSVWKYKHRGLVEHRHPEHYKYLSHLPEYYSLNFIMKLPE